MHPDELDIDPRRRLLAMKRRDAPPRLAPGQEGFTLVELLVGASVGLLVVGAMVMLLTSTLRSQPQGEDRSAQIQDARVVLERTVRELRQGKAVTGVPATESQITVDAFTRSGCNGGPPTTSAVVCRVTYACTGVAGSVTCTRKAGTAAAQTILTGLTTASVFSYGSTTAPDCNVGTIGTPRLVCMKLSYPGDGGAESVTVEDSAYLRNAST